MPRTADHIVAVHQLATERRNSGRKIWDETVRIHLNDPEKTFEETRDGVVAAIKSTRWFKGESTFSDLYCAVEEMEGTERQEEFNMALDAIYDEADYARVFIESVKP